MPNADILVGLRDLHSELAGINDGLKPNERVDLETIDLLGDLLSDVGSRFDQIRSNNQGVSVAQFRAEQNRIDNFQTHGPRVHQFLSGLNGVIQLITNQNGSNQETTGSKKEAI